MKLRNFITLIPGHYYYATRYSDRIGPLAHILKYWLTGVLAMMLFTDVHLRDRGPLLAIGWLAFLSLYDIFSRENDERAASKESRGTLRHPPLTLPTGAFCAWRLLVLAVLLAAAFVLQGLEAGMMIAVWLLVTALCYAAHNRLPQVVRPITFYALYICKGGLFLIAAAFGPSELVEAKKLMLFLVLFNATYLPHYIIRKFKDLHRDELTVARLGLSAFVIIQPIVLKNLVFVGLLFVDVRFLWLLGWVDAVTLLEFLARSRTAVPAHSPVTVSVLGTRLDLLETGQLIEAICRLLDSGRRRCVMASGNVYSFNIAYEQAWYRDFMNAADLVHLDGAGLGLGARLLGHHVPPRTTWADFAWIFAEVCARRGYSMFFFGARPGVAEKAAARLRERYPALNVTGFQHGYLDRRPASPENDELIRRINAVKPHVLLLGFGMPHQEQWLTENLRQLDIGIAMIGGSVFDFVAGEAPRAPRWMLHSGMEWLYRLRLEPRRMWKRYVIGNPLFMFRILKTMPANTPLTPGVENRL